MEGELKTGTNLISESGTRYTVKTMLGSGGQGEVYDVESGGKHYALKWYFKGNATTRQKEMLEKAIEKGSPDNSFLWPMELVNPDNSPVFGYIMPLRPSNYKCITDLMFKKAEPSFFALCRTAFNCAKEYQKLHAAGAKYQDISFGNLFFDPSNGDVLICDNDNVSYDSKPGGILGTPGFMAPEIVVGKAKPSRNTDLYSLSVLLFYLFMVNHPLDGKVEANIKCMDMAARIKLYGTDPIFIFDPDNKMNRPVKGYQDNALIYWPIYPEKLRSMFTKAFTIGLTTPNKRITEPQWMDLIANMMSGMMQCPKCGARIFFDEEIEKKGAAHTCWNCQNPVQVPVKIRIGKNVVLLNQNTKLTHHHVYGDYDMDHFVGAVVQNPKNPNLWGIRNEDTVNWTYEKADGTQLPIEIGRTAAIAPGVKIHFSDSVGEFN